MKDLLKILILGVWNLAAGYAVLAVATWEPDPVDWGTWPVVFAIGWTGGTLLLVAGLVTLHRLPIEDHPPG